MEVTNQIDRSFTDEHVIGIDPPMRPSLPDVWRRRIHAFPGRALSDKAMTAEQALRSGMQRLYGLSLTSGVVDGLELMAEADALGAAPDAARIRLEPGVGLARSGEDISVGRTVRLPIGRLPVIGRVDASGDAEVGEKEGFGFAGAAARLRPGLPRKIGASLAETIEVDGADELPRIAVIIAQPVSAELIGRPLDDCRPDPRDDPYVDLQRIDGMRLALYLWPSEIVSLDGGPDYSLPPRGAAWRNRLAHAVFAVEPLLDPDVGHPWEAWGVPLALVGFEDDWRLAFVDRHAVVRGGGMPRARCKSGLAAGDDRLWQARLDQFITQLAQTPSFDSGTLQATFERLPPVGLLPAAMFDPYLRKQHFFPGGFEIAAAPVAHSSLDLALAEAAGLAPIERGDPDAVELLVPVPDEFYEPRLLQTEMPDRRFGIAIRELRQARTEALIRRQMARRRHDRLLETVTGLVPGWQDSDLPLEENSPKPYVQVPVEVTQTRRFTEISAKRSHEVIRANATLSVSGGDRIWFWVRIHDSSRMTGFSLRLGTERQSSGAPQFEKGVFWGDPDVMPIASEAQGLQARRIGDLPQEGDWVRMEVPAEAVWDSKGGTLAGFTIHSVEFTQRGGDVEWASFGKLDRSGQIFTYLADDAPAGASLTVDGSQAGWPWQVVPGREKIEVPDFGTMLVDDVRRAAALDAFRDRWTQPFLKADLDSVDEDGIEYFLKSVDARLKATNDAIDLGFVRARSDIYRVRQIMLGADAASRLVTSPALADLAKRNEGARATSEKIGSFLEQAIKRDAKAGSFVIGDTSPPPAETPPPSRPTFRPELMTLNIEHTAIARVATPAPTPTFTAFLPAMSATPLFMSTARSSTTMTAAAAAPTARTVLAAGTSLAGGAAIVPDVLKTPTLLRPHSIAAVALDRRLDRYKAIDVQRQIPIAGLVERTVSVAERLKPQPAVEALQYAIGSKAAVIRTLASLSGGTTGRPRGIALGDIPIAGFHHKTKTGDVPSLDELLADQRREGAQVFIDEDTLPASQEGKHEADYFSAAVEAIDNSIAIMRLVEGRVALFEELASSLAQLKDDVLGAAEEARVYLREIDTDVAELRHDLSTAERLRNEDAAQVDATNLRRSQVLRDKVRGIAWRRRRCADIHDEVPVISCSSGLVEEPIAACRRGHDDIPDEIQEYVQLLREVPLSWFPRIAAMVARIDRLDPIRRTIERVRERAIVPRQFAPLAAISANKSFLGSVHQALAVGRTKVESRRTAVASINFTHLPGLTLGEAQTQLKAIATLGDLIAGTHRKPEIARAATEQLEAIAATGGCLQESFGEVAPIVRLAWAETLSEFDRPAPLHSLAALPRWSEVPPDLRRTQQSLVDFLFAQIDSQNEDARDAINEFIRVCLLMAAHSPVDRIIPARLVEPAPARIGGRLPLALDIRRVRKGMLALIRDDRDRIVSQAVVEDIADGLAQARITRLHAAITTIVPTMRIELAGTKLR